jgi:hypothetical protein
MTGKQKALLVSDEVLRCAICSMPFHPWKYAPNKCCSRVCAGLLRRQQPLDERFWKKVQIRSKEECWLWKGSTNQDGYGAFWVQDRLKLAHRIAWILTNGPIPEGLNVLHKCDVRTCCNPGHYFLGTHGDNCRDRTKKKRTASGEYHGRHILTESQAVEILALHKQGWSQRLLGEKFEVSKSAIKHLLKGRNWKHLQPAIQP